ncbi:MAG: hypothetical protein EHM84_06765, partial [Lysobacterales bacterium]
MNIDAALSGSERAPVAVVSAEGEGRLSVTEAARAVATARHQKPAPGSDRGPRDQQELPPAKAGGEQRATPASAGAGGAAQQPPAQESAEEAGTAPPEMEVRGEIESADPATAELPPIEPPRSWTKEDKELFTSLPRATQERIAERERSRES